MSKILPKSMPSQSSQNVAPNQSRNENTDNDAIFAALFGDASVEAQSDGSMVMKSLNGDTTSTKFVGENAFVGPENEDAPIGEPNDDSMTSIASSLLGRGSKLEAVGWQGEESNLEQNETSLDNDKLDGLALSNGAEPPSKTKGGIVDKSRPLVTGLANMAFDDRKKTKFEAEKTALRHKLGSGNNALQNRPPTHFIGPQIAQESNNKTVGALDNGFKSSVSSDLAKLHALRAANLEQKNAELDEKLLKGDVLEINGKLSKNDLTGARLKQMMVSSGNPIVAIKNPLSAEGGRTGSDITRLTGASAAAVDNASAIGGAGGNGSSNGQFGGHTGQQGSAQTGAQSNSGLLNNLNSLQMLDTAKDNWTEMLLQRVRNGLSGGKEHLDFQLNPRNLGRMRISLVMQNDRANIQIQTETSAAASMFSDSEARLSQMLEASGLRLGNLNSGQFQGFDGTGSEQQANRQSQEQTDSKNKLEDSQDDGDIVAETAATQSDNLINIQA